MPKLQLTLKDLHYVVALADHGHFGRAAAACNISQPTLSTQVKKLEQGLGLVLFERTTQSVSVTDIGRDIVGRARSILAEVEAIGSVGHDQASPLTGMFRLGVIPTLGPYLLPWLVPALKASYTELRLAVREDLTLPLLERLHLNRLDAVLVALPIDEEGLDTLPMFDEPFRFAEPRQDSPAAGVMSEAELRGQRLLLLTEGHCLRDQALAICGTSDPDLDGDFARPASRRSSRWWRPGWATPCCRPWRAAERAPGASRRGRWHLGWTGGSALHGAAAAPASGTSIWSATSCGRTCQRASAVSKRH